MAAPRNIKDLDLRGKKALIRVDFNVPIKNGAIQDDTRIRASLPTIRYALEQGATVILMSHLGRPKGKPNLEFTLKPVAEHLSTLLGKPVQFADGLHRPGGAGGDRQGGSGRRRAAREPALPRRGREERSRRSPQQLAALGDVYVNDAFGSAHRAHASTEGIVSHVKASAAGLLMADEIAHLGQGARSAGAAVRGDPRRREGVGQARSHREPDPARRRAADRRRDGLHVPEGARRGGRQVAGRGRPARHGPRRRAAGQGARTPAASCRSITSSRRSSRPARRRRR